MATHGNLQFQFSSKTKTWCLVLIILGLVTGIGGFMTDHTEHHQYAWSILFICSFFFFAVSLGALFFYALQYAAEVAWSSMVKRVFEAMFAYVPLGLGVVLAILLAGQLHLNHLWHWMDDAVNYEYVIEGTTNYTNDATVAGAVANPDYDKLIAGKQPYLSPWFFWLRAIVYAVVFVGFALAFRKWSLREDEVGGTELHYKMYRKGAVFLVFFAVFSSTLSWDWLMSIDVHWFSTMYGWYIFSGMWVTCMIFALLMVLWLKGKGYLPMVNKSHIHDMGKWVFAVSMLWSYLWFCQYMLIWYSNIPEEVTYFVER